MPTKFSFMFYQIKKRWINISTNVFIKYVSKWWCFRWKRFANCKHFEAVLIAKWFGFSCLSRCRMLLLPLFCVLCMLCCVERCRMKDDCVCYHLMWGLLMTYLCVMYNSIHGKHSVTFDMTKKEKVNCLLQVICHKPKMIQHTSKGWPASTNPQRTYNLAQM